MAAPMVINISFCKLCGRSTLFSRFYRYRTSLNKQKRLLSTSTSPQHDSRAPADDRSIPWQPVIGLEIHAQIQAESKLFSGASAKYGSPVNTQVAFLDTALPGTLPVLNKRCVEAGVMTALALGCTINNVSTFDRKHYFYADLPSGYQITQQRRALANNGRFIYHQHGRTQADSVEKTVNITQLQLEQDSGCALMEIITEPEFTTGEEVRWFVKDMQRMLKALGTCNGKMEEGSMRVDANISVHKPGQPLGVRSEVKNINNLNSLNKAIDYEIQRQIKVLESGEEVVNETRSFDVDLGETVAMRDKEAKQDYRFIPEPNLPPLHVYSGHHDDKTPPPGAVVVETFRQQMPRLPRDIRLYLIEKYRLSLYRADFLVCMGLVSFYESLAESRDAKQFTTFVFHDIMHPILERDLDVTELDIPVSVIGDLYDWFSQYKLAKHAVNKIMVAILDEGRTDAAVIADELDLWQINDKDYLTEVCQKVMADNPKAVNKWVKGNKKGINRLMGQVRKESNDKGNPIAMEKILIDLLDEEKNKRNT